MKLNLDIVAAAKKHFLSKAHQSQYPIAYIFPHMIEVEKWTRWILKKYPNADPTIVLLSVWLHDIGQTFGSRKEDHAIKSEQETRRFLKKFSVSSIITERVAHCVRAHRCKDVQPETIEAKIIAAADSASHFTDSVYLDIVVLTSKRAALQKLERDYRDAGLLPGFKREIDPIYRAWKRLLKVLPVRS